MLPESFKRLISLWNIIGVYRKSAFILLVIMLSCAFTEALGLGMMLPLLEVITASASGASSQFGFFSSFLNFFPPQHSLLIVSLLLVILILIKNVLFIWQTAFSSYFTLRFQRLWQSVIINKYMQARYAFFLSHRQGELLNNLLVEPPHAAKSLQQIIEFFSQSVLVVFLYGLLLLINCKITFSLTALAVITMLLLRKVTRNYALNIGKKKLSFSQEIASLAAENISAIRQVKIFSLEGDVYKKFTQKLDVFLRVFARFKIFHSLPRPILETLVVAGVVFALLFIRYFTKLPLVEVVPLLGVFVIISQKFFPTLATLFASRMDILTFIPSLELVHRLYTSAIEQEELEKGAPMESLKEDIIFENIYFSYTESKPVFEGLNIKIPRARTIALIGPSGSGKTTLVDLLSGFFSAEKGRILINGLDIKDIKLSSWRRRIGYVSQDVFLFNASIEENILAGKPDASREELVSACRRAHAEEFILKLPQGFGTLIGDRGLKLSGGQRQRLAIARALIRDPDLLIFDEATSSLDSESERFIQQSIAELTHKKTLIIISHRFSSVKNADLIYVVDQGKAYESKIN